MSPELAHLEGEFRIDHRSMFGMFKSQDFMTHLTTKDFYLFILITECFSRQFDLQLCFQGVDLVLQNADSFVLLLCKKVGFIHTCKLYCTNEIHQPILPLLLSLQLGFCDVIQGKFVTSSLQFVMLGETRKSASIRKSAKLPKLNIQQQIENQQIADRMNRKVTFTRNPRHLAQTITYASALSSSAEISKFRVEPAELRFSHYEAMHVYEAEVRLVNNSKHIQRIKVAPLKTKEFVLAQIRYPREDSGDIAPGMAVTIAVRFRPPGLGDYEDQLVVIAGDGTVRVPIVAMRQRCEINWPKTISCGHCWVGDLIKKEIVLRNRGGQAQFFLLGSNQDEQQFKSGFFSISPTTINFEKNTQATITVEFVPQQQGVFKELIRFKSYQGDQDEIEIGLEGGAYSAQIVMEELNGQKLLEQRMHNTLYLNDTELGRPTTASLKVRNLAVVQVDYFWHFQSRNLTIDNSKSKMKPSELLPFNLTFIPQQNTPESIRLELYLFGLPEKSLPGSVVSKKINGIDAIQCLTVEVKTRPAYSPIQLFPLHREIVQPIYENCPVSETITIANKSSVRRHFTISKVRQDSGLIATPLQNEGVLEPNSDTVIPINFHLKTLTPTAKYAYFLTSFDNAPSQVFSLEGKSTFPDLIFQEELIYFGLVKTFTQNRKKLTLRNPQKTPVRFRVHNPHRFYVLDFYDFYEFEDEQSYKRRLNFYDPSTGQEVLDWVTLAPETTLHLDCLFNALQAESIDLGVLLEIEHGRRVGVQVVGEVQDVAVEMSRTSINLREIYKGNIYNSNKFLSRELQLANHGHHDCAFEIVPPAFPQCDLRIQPLKGIIKAKKTQRIDLILQPIQTGDFDLRVHWRFFDDFKVNPDLYIDLAEQIQFNTAEGSKSLFKQRQLALTGTIRGMAMNYYIKDQTRARRVRQKIQDIPQSVKLSASSFSASMKSSKNLLQNQKIIYPNLEQLTFYNCEINQVRQVQIIIENDSGLTTEYEVSAELFHTLQKYNEFDRKSNRGLIKVQEEPFSSQMGKTFVRNKALDRSQKVHLGNNKGISILCEPAFGTLHKKQSQRILITMFNDTSGRFKDYLLINVKNHEIKKIPIDIHIKGTPVALSRNQLGIDFAQEVPFMNLGTLLHSNGITKRTIKVVNNGPKEVDLRWLVYPYNQPTQDRDIFRIQFKEAAPGNGNILDLNWNAIKPEVDSNSYLSIEPKQRKVKGREQVTFTVLIQEIKEVGTFSSLLICQPHLIDGTNRTSMESLAVVVTTQTIAPLLTMDTKHKNHINKLQKFALPPQEYQTNGANNLRKLKLKNTLKANLTFDISIINKDPKFESFKVIEAKTNSPATALLASTISPQTAFTLTSDSILEVTVELNGSPSNLSEWPMEEKVRKDGILNICFSNGSQQSIELAGWLYRPWLAIQMPNGLPYSNQNAEIDFGTVHYKNSKKLTFFLANPSKVDARFSLTYIKYQQSMRYKFQQSLWTAQDYEDQTICDQKKCWRLSADSGIVRNRTLPVHYIPSTLALPSTNDAYAETHQPLQLTIMFKPEANLLYKSKFRLTVTEGLTFDIVVKGRGTYEEEQQKK